MARRSVRRSVRTQVLDGTSLRSQAATEPCGLPIAGAPGDHPPPSSSGVRGRAKETNGLPKPSHTGRGAKPTGLVSGRTRPSTNAPSKLARTSSPGRVGGSGSAGDFDGWHDVECRSRQRRLCMCDGPLTNVTTDRVYRAEAFGVMCFQPSRSRRTWILPSSHNLPNVLSQNSLTFPICSSISVFKCRAPACQSSVV